MKISEIFDNIVNRYSSYFIVGLMLLTVLSIKLFTRYFVSYENQTLIWIVLIFGSTILLPILCMAAILIYKAFWDIENKFSAFRIKNKLINNCIYKIIFNILFIVAWISLIFIICNFIFYLIINPNIQSLFFPIGFLLMIAIMPFYWLIKKILHNIAACKC